MSGGYTKAEVMAAHFDLDRMNHARQAGMVTAVEDAVNAYIRAGAKREDAPIVLNAVVDEMLRDEQDITGMLRRGDLCEPDVCEVRTFDSCPCTAIGTTIAALALTIESLRSEIAALRAARTEPTR